MCVRSERISLCEAALVESETACDGEENLVCLLSERTRSKSDSHCVFIVSILLSSVAKRVISAGRRR